MSRMIGWTELTQHLPGGIFCCQNEPHLTICVANPVFYALTGYRQAEFEALTGGRFMALVHADDCRTAAAILEEVLTSEVELELRLRQREGGYRRTLCQLRPIPSSRQLCGLLIDLTRRGETQEALRLSAERMQVIMDQTNDILFEWNLVTDVIQFSSNWKQRFVYSPIELVSGSWLSAPNSIYGDDHEAYLQLLARVKAGTPYLEAEFRILSLSEKYLWHRARVTVQYDDQDVPVRAVGVLIDIDAEKHKEHRLQERARRDALTDLYNKTAAQAQTELLIASWTPDTVQALLIIDLDNFKQINDQYGHLCGDGLLIDLASCLKNLFRSGDNIGRIGGDEFLAYLPGLPNREVAMYKAKAVLDALSQLPLREGGTRGISCSIGIAFYPEDGTDYCQLYRCADLALYRAKSLGKSDWAVYDAITCQNPHTSAVVRRATNINGNDCCVDEHIDQQLAQFSLQLLYSTVSTQTAVQQILALIGRTYNASRAYIFEFSSDGDSCYNTFEWCNDGVEPQISDMQDCVIRTIDYEYVQGFDENGVFYCQDTTLLEPEIRAWMSSRNIYSVLQCLIQDENTLQGFVGYDDCCGVRSWSREQIQTLSMVAGVLAIFLLKLRLKERIALLEQRAERKDLIEEQPPTI